MRASSTPCSVASYGPAISARRSASRAAGTTKLRTSGHAVVETAALAHVQELLRPARLQHPQFGAGVQRSDRRGSEFAHTLGAAGRLADPDERSHEPVGGAAPQRRLGALGAAHTAAISGARSVRPGAGRRYDDGAYTLTIKRTRTTKVRVTLTPTTGRAVSQDGEAAG